ncbi:hypothetical protein H6F75_13995 [Nodosilinea sp. FACHB-131]|jgi:hypothetical protein|uniref:Uncharacterized protein n=1 Tax=Leptolyngbya subtilissima DQ-A4 TaxID=2933933 RepID=A0ABV0JZZ0_9CYAN|nr:MULTISPECIES: hypothetical protein [unclassified Nodosilinea]MBD1874598.1 hypothetical protein [Nodosilinea sp. FACHB-131]MBD2110197.1 hypothetical protein [Nodosilinea sp. FACHB-13]MBD2110383.1 hypothetical protein [Nodosilinea sp. FACHB-141]
MGTLIALLLAVIYGGGAFKFWTGFNRTNFTDGRVKFTLLWPLFLALNKSYRQNFSRALKG